MSRLKWSCEQSSMASTPQSRFVQLNSNTDQIETIFRNWDAEVVQSTWSVQFAAAAAASVDVGDVTCGDVDDLTSAMTP